MNPSMPFPAPPGAAIPAPASLRAGHDTDPDDEAAEVVRIRLWNSLNGCAMVSEFYSADRVLASWAERSGGSPIVFEVVFDDGLVVQGAHEFFRKGRRKCLFATHVQRILRRESGPPLPAPASPPHGLTRCYLRG
jgi:hypothetical protein